MPGSDPDAMKNRYTYRIPEQQNLWEATRIVLRRIRTLVNTPMIGINENGQSVEDLSEYNILREAMARTNETQARQIQSLTSTVEALNETISKMNAEQNQLLTYVEWLRAIKTIERVA